ncbi:MAG TPA: HAMP domain-containing sensor histidine kinase [Candidatus Paceibacterota bacterium]
MNYEILLLVLAVIVIGKIIWNKFKSYETLKYEFVTIIAHKFRTPLTQMKWILETLKEKEQDSYKLESIKTLEQSNRNLISLTGTLIELTDSADTSLASYTFEKINACEMVNGMVSSLKDSFHEKNLFLGVKCASEEIFVMVDKPRMDFVLQTIMENAIRYSPPGRSVDIEVGRVKNKAIISVKDYGIGIDPADMGNVFSKFFRAPNAQNMDTEGFGVGLYLAQSIARRHNGKIEVFSEGLEKGTTFSVVLPLTK